MIEEAGYVVAVEDDLIWVETIRTSPCDTCSVQKGCGHGLVNKASSGKTFRFSVERQNQEVSLGDQVTLGIPEDSLIKASLFCYLMPMLLLILGATAGHLLINELFSILGGLLGLVTGFLLVKRFDGALTFKTTPVLLSVNK